MGADTEQPEGTNMVDANSTHPIATEPRELDSRTSDGIHVQLLWYPLDGHVSVAVNDTKTGAAFELEVSRGQHPIDVFHHPYAYAATTVPSPATAWCRA
jgi:hypothetical protein